MGAAFSSSNALLIQTTKPAYFAGEVLEGVVALNCLNPITTSGIEVEVVGYEDTSYTTQETGASSSFDDDFGTVAGSRMHSGRNDLFRATVPIGPAGTLQPGQYQFGFKLSLPDTLPPTFYSSRGGDRGQVVYKIHANVAKNMAFDISSEQTIVVLPRPPMDARPVGNAVTENMTQCCCIPKGQASAQLQLEKDAVVGGEAVAVTIQARNGTSTQIEAVNVNLKRRISLSATGNATNNYYSRHFTDIVATAATPGLRPGESAEGPTARRIMLQIPHDVLPTVVGRLVQCHYVIEVELKAGMGTSSVRTQVPVRAMPMPPAGTGQFGAAPGKLQAPADWKPSQVFPTVDVPVQPATPMQAQPMMPTQQQQQPYGYGAAMPAPQSSYGVGYQPQQQQQQQQQPGMAAPVNYSANNNFPAPVF